MSTSQDSSHAAEATTAWKPSKPPVETLDPETVALGEQIVAADNKVVPDFWVQKYKREAAKNWDRFYQRNKTNFFKDRHWTDREFEELRIGQDEHKVILEVGCGVGNFVFPLLESYPALQVYACDFSSKAIEFVKANEQYDAARCTAFVCDLTQDALTDNVPAASVDLVSMVFVLSAIPAEKMQFAVDNAARTLKPGGKVLFRDYALYDEAQLRFKPGHRLETNLYVRQDGTMAYYFTTEKLQELAQASGLAVEECVYVHKEVVNRKQEMRVARIFVQAKLVKV
ncbi:hypothetical protein RI367_002336 [Sorochytrium milnesiophthora]